jgi:release factor glutamine methyltransferase
METIGRHVENQPAWEARPMERGSVVARLAAAGCVAADDEADILLASAPDPSALEGWIRRREDGEPLAWIVGAATFCGRRVRIEPGVYVPRPQTEELARRATALLPPGGRAADLCTGSGAVASVTGAIGVDVDERAVRCARTNGVPAVVGDLGAPLLSAAFDVVTAVPPYVPTDAIGLLPADVQRHEPRAALDGGGDGLDAARRVVADAARLLKPGGWLVMELGGEQDRILAGTLASAGFTTVEPWHDEDGDLRGVAARHP